MVCGLNHRAVGGSCDNWLAVERSRQAITRTISRSGWQIVEVRGHSFLKILHKSRFQSIVDSALSSYSATMLSFVWAKCSNLLINSTLS
jgi:hypothetical protein